MIGQTFLFLVLFVHAQQSTVPQLRTMATLLR